MISLSIEIEKRILELREYPISQDWSHHPIANELELILQDIIFLERNEIPK